MNARFVTDNGIRVPAVTADQMREIDRIATQETGPNLLQMMENAGRNLALHTIDVLGSSWHSARVVVLAGGGGNGGGGICAARHLANRNVDVALAVPDSDRMSEVTALQRKVFRHTQGREIDPPALIEETADLIIDALIGYGLQEAPRGRVVELIAWANSTGAPILALDVPSGLDATRGGCPGACVRASLTLTLALPKTGLASDMVGELWLADLGIPRATYECANVTYVDPFGARYRVRLTRDVPR